MPAKTASTPRRLSGGKAKTAASKAPKGTLIAKTNVKADYTANMYYLEKGSLYTYNKQTKKKSLKAKNCCEAPKKGKMQFTSKGANGNVEVRETKMKVTKKKACA